MKYSLCYFILALCLLTITICGVTQAQWMQTNGPHGGYIYCFIVNGSNLFAGTDGKGVFISTNNGASWSEVNNGLEISAVYALAVNG